MHFSGEMGPFNAFEGDKFCEDRFCTKCGAGMNCQRVRFFTKRSGEVACICGKTVLFKNGKVVAPEQRVPKRMGQNVRKA